jgi:phage/plasmid-associated DNA primase
MTINAKYKRQVRNITINAAPLMQSNEIPVLPNKGRGLSGKMMVLPFEVSFEGREDFDLEDDLRRELPGIAAWAVQGAIDLENADRENKWPVPDAAGEAMRLYHLQNNPFDSFLEARFHRNSSGFTANSIVRTQWNSWLKANGVKMHVPKNILIQKIVQDSSWDLRQTRQSVNEGHDRGVSGLTLKIEHDDEH